MVSPKCSRREPRLNMEPFLVLIARQPLQYPDYGDAFVIPVPRRKLLGKTISECTDVLFPYLIVDLKMCAVASQYHHQLKSRLHDVFSRESVWLTTLGADIRGLDDDHLLDYEDVVTSPYGNYRETRSLCFGVVCRLPESIFDIFKNRSISQADNHVSDIFWEYELDPISDADN